MEQETNGPTRSAVEEARELLQQKRPADAARVMREHLAGTTGTADEQMLLGVAAAQAGENLAAIQALQQAIALAPDNAAAHFNLGQIYRRVGRSTDALSEFERALQLRPDYPAAASAAAELREQIAAASTPSGPTPAAGAAPLTGERPQRMAGPPPAAGWMPPAAPGYGAPYGAETARARPERPTGISVMVILGAIVGVLCAVLGGFVVLGGLALAALAARGGGPPGAAPPGAAVGLVIAMGVFLVLWSVAIIVVGVFLWNGSRWARGAYMGLLIVRILTDAFTLVRPGASGLERVLALLFIVIVLLFLIVLNTQEAKAYCSM